MPINCPDCRPCRDGLVEFNSGDENIADAARIAISRCNMMCEFQQAPSILSSSLRASATTSSWRPYLHSYWEGERVDA